VLHLSHPDGLIQPGDRTMLALAEQVAPPSKTSAGHDLPSSP
jgi:hypothetical protein